MDLQNLKEHHEELLSFMKTMAIAVPTYTGSEMKSTVYWRMQTATAGSHTRIFTLNT